MTLKEGWGPGEVETREWLSKYYCDIIGCENEGAKVLTLGNAGFLTRHIGDDRFDVCWKHYIETLERFKEVIGKERKQE